jgi:hypothetical protein
MCWTSTFHQSFTVAGCHSGSGIIVRYLLAFDIGRRDEVSDTEAVFAKPTAEAALLGYSFIHFSRRNSGIVFGIHLVIAIVRFSVRGTAGYPCQQASSWLDIFKDCSCYICQSKGHHPSRLQCSCDH